MNVKFKIMAASFYVLVCVQDAYSSLDSALAFIRSKVHNDRRVTFEVAAHLMTERHVKTIVETGTTRDKEGVFDSNGGFTVLFGYWSALHQADLYSVDINPVAVENARTMLFPGSENNVHLIVNDSVHFLKNFDKPIDFLYLDSFDFDGNNPLPSQLHHLYEIEAAYDKLSPNAVVMIDDCGLVHGGKGELVIYYLRQKGWRVYVTGYQIIMVRK